MYISLYMLSVFYSPSSRLSRQEGVKGGGLKGVGQSNQTPGT